MNNNRHSDWQSIHSFWFADLSFDSDYMKNRGQLWFGKDPNIDQHMRKTFMPLLQDFDAGRRFSEWKDSPQSYVSLIVLLDQFPRNIFRETPKMYQYDQAALNLTLEGLRHGIDQDLHPHEKVFFYLPLEHSEDIQMQRLSVKLFMQLMEENAGFKEHYSYAVKHYDIVAQFERFPHRNTILGRQSTQEELEFLKKPGSSF